MHQKNFVICDQEADYARNLMQMIGGRKELGFQMHMFQKLEPLKKFAEQKPIQILLIGEEYSQEERLEIPAAERFVLVKAEGRYLADEEKELYKYQSVDQILTKVLELSVDKERAVAKTLRKTRGSLIGVYSPIHRIGKTKYALELGKELAEKGPVLYLNLEEYAGFEELMQKKFLHTLSDLLYFVKQGSTGIAVKMNGMAESMGNVDFIPPVQSPEDIRGTSWQDWEHLLQEIILHSSYETIVLDIGNGIEEVFQMLDMCTTVYTPIKTDKMSRSKLAQFEELLSVRDYPQILSRMVKLNLPYGQEVLAEPFRAEQLVWGTLGDFVRELLGKDEV